MLNCGHVFLTGFSGSGKSTVGRLLAARLRRRFVDTDSAVERLAGCTITDIFQRSGEREFRRLEREAIACLIDSRKPLVIALGGGALMSIATRRTVAAAGCVVYLSCSRRELCRRTRAMSDRPMLESKRGGHARSHAALVSELLARRMPGYRRADISYSTTHRTSVQAVREIVRKLEGRYGCS